jgi:hypothetical protein
MLPLFEKWYPLLFTNVHFARLTTAATASVLWACAADWLGFVWALQFIAAL